MAHEHIALALGINRSTLERHYEHELSVGAFERRIEALQGMHKAAARGNVSAAKAYVAGLPELAVPPLPAAGDEAAPSAPPAAPATPVAAPKGKKEQAQADAVTAQTGTGWEGLLPSAPTMQ